MDYQTERHIITLLDRSSACLGMLAEIKSKCSLLKSRMKEDPSEETLDYIMRSKAQMKRDLAKYSRKLEQIYEELNSYGMFSDLGRMENS